MLPTGYASCTGSDSADGAGGGGGYYGGGSRVCDGCGGGGGSGYLHPSIVAGGSTPSVGPANTTATTYPPQTGIPEYAGAAGRGGATCADGQPGRVVIRME